MTMTKNDFLSGRLFKYKADKYTFYSFVPYKDAGEQPGCIMEHTGKSKDNILHTQHHANVKTVTNYRVQVYTTVFGKSITVWRRLSDFELV